MAHAFHLLNRKTTNCWSIPFGHQWHMACPALNSILQTRTPTWEATSRESVWAAYCGYSATWRMLIVSHEDCVLFDLCFQSFLPHAETHLESRAQARSIHKAKKCSAHSWFEACGAVSNQSNFGDKGIGLSRASAFLTCHGNVTDVLEPVKCPLPSEVGPFFPLLTGGENI